MYGLSEPRRVTVICDTQFVLGLLISRPKEVILIQETENLGSI